MARDCLSDETHFQIYLLPYDSSIEFPSARLSVGRQIGAGAFGRVMEGTAFGQNISILLSEESSTNSFVIGFLQILPDALWSNFE